MTTIIEVALMGSIACAVAYLVTLWLNKGLKEMEADESGEE